ncbi:MAG: flagellar biosynthetic protein FliO [Planctomycetes bacterium]|nr:flagellar biosynthetic protein FliO [Planctomycetota bacterium]
MSRTAPVRALALAAALLASAAVAQEVDPQGPPQAAVPAEAPVPSGAAAPPGEGPPGADFAEWLYGQGKDAAPGPPAAEAPSAGEVWTRMALTSLGVLGVIVLAALAARRLLPGARLGSPARHLRVVGRAPLGPRHSVCLVRVGRRVLVLGVGPEGVNALATVDDPEEVAHLASDAIGRPDGSIVDSFRQVIHPMAPPPPGRPGDAPGDAPPERGASLHQVRTELDRLRVTLGSLRA